MALTIFDAINAGLISGPALKSVDWLDMSDEEIKAVSALSAVATDRRGNFCITRMEPTSRSPQVEYWASIWWSPNFSLTEKASTPTQAAQAILDQFKKPEHER